MDIRTGTASNAVVGLLLLAVTGLSIAMDTPVAASLGALALLVAATGRRAGRERAARVAMCSTVAYVVIANPRAQAHNGVLATSELAAMAALLAIAWITPRARSGGALRARPAVGVRYPAGDAAGACPR